MWNTHACAYVHFERNERIKLQLYCTPNNKFLLMTSLVLGIISILCEHNYSPKLSIYSKNSETSSCFSKREQTQRERKKHAIKLFLTNCSCLTTRPRENNDVAPVDTCERQSFEKLSNEISFHLKITMIDEAAAKLEVNIFPLTISIAFKPKKM